MLRRVSVSDGAGQRSVVEATVSSLAQQLFGRGVRTADGKRRPFSPQEVAAIADQNHAFYVQSLVQAATESLQSVPAHPEPVP